MISYRKKSDILQGYRPCSQRASILFFVMNDMGRIDPMYQFSLDAYIELFNNSIDKSLKHPKLDERINFLNDYHTYAVYQYVIVLAYRYCVLCDGDFSLKI